MKSVALCPVTSKNAYIAKAIMTNCPDIFVDTVVVPNAFKKPVEKELGERINIVHKISDLPEEIDEVIFLSYWNHERLKESIIEAIKKKTSIICTAGLEKSDMAFLQKHSSAEGVSLSFLNNENTMDLIKQHGEMYTPQSSIVIAVGGLTKGISTSETIVELKAQLDDYGYITSVIASDPDLQVLGYDYLPIEEMIEQNLDNTIMGINRFFSLHEMDNKPNIIVLQLPDEGLHRISLDYETCFGALTYLISQAVGIDYAIMLSPIIDPDADIYHALSQISSHRFGFKYNCVCVLPQVIDTNSPQGAENVDYYVVTNKEMNSVAEALAISAKDKKCLDTLFVSKKHGWLTDVTKDIIAALS